MRLFHRRQRIVTGSKGGIRTFHATMPSSWCNCAKAQPLSPSLFHRHWRPLQIKNNCCLSQVSVCRCMSPQSKHWGTCLGKNYANRAPMLLNCYWYLQQTAAGVTNRCCVCNCSQGKMNQFSDQFNGNSKATTSCWRSRPRLQAKAHILS